MPERTMRPVRIGVFGIGLAAYWPQFPGMKPRLEGYQKSVEDRVAAMGVEVVSAGLVDDAPGAQAAGDQFATAAVDLILCYVGTYATSSQVLPAVQRHRAPVLILKLQPVPAMDMERTDTGEWLANGSVVSVPEISNAFARSGIQFNVVTGLLEPVGGDVDRYHTDAFLEIEEWIKAAAVKNGLSRGRIGFLGHTYPGMLDMYSDLTMAHAHLGLHIEVLEMEDLEKRVESVTDSQVATKETEIRDVFEFVPPGRDRISMAVTDEGLNWSARVACGLDILVEDFELDGLAYYYRGLDGNKFEELGASLIVGNSLLTGRGIPAAGEGDLKTCIAMLIMDRLGAGGSFTEFYGMDLNDRILLMGHDGPGHVAISEGRPSLRGLGLFHGKRGYGLSVQFNVKLGPVTILCVSQTVDGRFKMIAAHGMSEPGPTLQVGNTNSRIRFALDVPEFMARWAAEGPTHHVALGVGDQTSRLQKLARLLDIELAIV
ncbi:MAG: arabinose isomerase [Caldilineaceae bacterium SB0665_bin_21]|nr:arabinose isomerase [Caldilineaceae bacterium SB0665_bin_21]